MPTDARLEAAFTAFERSLFDEQHRFAIGREGCRLAAEELFDAIDAADPNVETEDTSGLVLVEEDLAHA